MEAPSGDQAGSFPNAVRLVAAPVAISTISMPRFLGRLYAIRVPFGDQEALNPALVNLRAPSFSRAGSRNSVVEFVEVVLPFEASSFCRIADARCQRGWAFVY